MSAFNKQPVEVHSNEEYDYTFSVFIPTYNRGCTLDRALHSLENQSFTDFEVLIIDDGSEDNTRELIKRWQQQAKFPIHYYWQENQGKHIAHNNALELSRGYFFVTLDSDDMLTPEALGRLKIHWDAIPDADKKYFAGVEGLCVDLDGKVAGTRFPEAIMDSNYLEIRKKYRIKGDKKNAIRTSVLRQFPYPCFPGERHIRPSLISKRMAHQYKFRYINEVIQMIEYRPDGLSANRFALRMHNPQGFRLFFLEEITLHATLTPGYTLYRYYSKYVRYSLHSKIGFFQQAQEVKSRAIWLISIPKGTIGWISDKARMLLWKIFRRHLIH
jgi:glycosyltransferase involved in cell wall biosynthesis